MMRIYRIADRRHPVWDGTGTMLRGGRFNRAGRPVIYGALTYAGAMLEVLVHSAIGRVPLTQVMVRAEVPDDVAVERADSDRLPAGWDARESVAAQDFGDQWLSEARSAVLLVPSVVAREEWNALVNPLHPLARRIVVSDPQPVVWDERLFSRAVPNPKRGH